MKKLFIIAALILSVTNTFAGTKATNAGTVDASSLIDMTPIKSHRAKAANVVNSENNKTKATVTINNNVTNNMTTEGFSNNPTAIGSTGATNVNGVGANISKAADQLMNNDANTPSNAIIVNYN